MQQACWSRNAWLQWVSLIITQDLLCTLTCLIVELTETAHNKERTEATQLMPLSSSKSHAYDFDTKIPHKCLPPFVPSHEQVALMSEPWSMNAFLMQERGSLCWKEISSWMRTSRIDKPWVGLQCTVRLTTGIERKGSIVPCRSWIQDSALRISKCCPLRIEDKRRKRPAMAEVKKHAL